MRIVFPYSNYWPHVRRGAERVIHDLTRYLAGRGHDVHIITTKPGRPREVVEDGVRITYLKQLSHPILFEYVPLEWAVRTGCEYVCLLNNDTTFEPGFLAALVRHAESSPTPAILTPLILTASGNQVWCAGGRLRWPWVAGEHLGEGQDPVDHDEPRQIDWASGCALFFHRTVPETIGPLDESLFLFLDDIEWCLRARHAAQTVWLVPGARMRHHGSKTVGQFDPRIVRYYSYRNFYRVGFRHSGRFWRAWFAVHLGAALLKSVARNALFQRYRRDAFYNARTRALLDVIRGRSGKAPYPELPPVNPEAASVGR